MFCDGLFFAHPTGEGNAQIIENGFSQRLSARVRFNMNVVRSEAADRTRNLRRHGAAVVLPPCSSQESGRRRPPHATNNPNAGR